MKYFIFQNQSAAVGVTDAVVALLDLFGFVETGINYSWFHTSISHISI